MRIVSLCSGVGGLEMGVQGETVAAFDVDPSARLVLTARFPDIAVYGDFRDADSLDEWRPDLVCAGLPCQPVSTAGQRKGTDDDRWLYDDMLGLLRRSAVKPMLWLENVDAILAGGRHPNFCARIASGLAAMGYVGRWGVVRADDAGAPHRRARWFSFCVPSELAALPDTQRRFPQGDPGYIPERAVLNGLPWSLLPTPISTDSKGPHMYPDPTRRLLRDVAFMVRDGWGPAAPAIRHWAGVIGRPHPPPTRRGKVVSAGFVEWLMGFPQGHVDDLLPNRRALKLLGNAVVPHQSALALRLLTSPPGCQQNEQLLLPL